MDRARYWASVDTFYQESRPDTLMPVLIPKLKRNGLPSEKLAMTGEEGSWSNSLPILAELLYEAGLHEAFVALEYNPHQMGSQRADALVIGTKNDRPAIVVIELKQWSAATWDPLEERCSEFGALYNDSAHPARQADKYAQFLRDYTEGFHQEDATITPAAFLHNATPQSISSLLSVSQFERDHTFTGEADDRKRFMSFLTDHLDNADGRAVADRLRVAKQHNSPALMEAAAGFFRDPKQFPLTPAQEDAVHEIQKVLAEVRDDHSAKDQAIIVVRGKPGSGKTWICLHLLAAECAAGHQVGLVTNSTALRASLKRAARKASDTRPMDGLISSGRMHWDKQQWNTMNLLIVDESQRLNRFTQRTFPRNRREVQEHLESKDITQLFELKKTAKVLVLMIDEGQTTTAKDHVTVAEAEKLAQRVGASFHSGEPLDLTEAHRSGGSKAFEEWVDNLVDGVPSVWHDEAGFTVEVADSPEDLEARITARHIEDDEHNQGRVVAGFAWTWRPWPKHPLGIEDVPFDIELGSWRKRWNLRKPIEGYPNSDGWASNPKGREQVGSLFSSQGFEFGHVGVLFGKDLVAASEGEPLAVHMTESKNRELVAMNAKDPESNAEDRIRNQYRVLLTRAMHSVVLYSVDEDTQNLFKRIVNPPEDHDATH